MQASQFVFVFICFTAATSALTEYGRCLSPKKENGTCVELQDCTILYLLLEENNVSVETRDYLRQSQCGFYQSKILICCPYSILNYKDIPNFRSPPVISNATELLPHPPQCGNVLSSRILGGTVAHIDEYPWLALIEYTKPGNRKGHHCGGTLINHLYVLTAAHCVNGQDIPEGWILTGVRLGEWDSTTNPDCEVDARDRKDCAPPHVDIGIEERIPHPQYVPNDTSQVNDIALLRLASQVIYTDFVMPICLPTEPTLRTESFSNIQLEIAGWGRTERSAVSPIKLKTTVIGWDFQKCQKAYAEHNINLVPKQLCAGGVEGVDSCRGDSGGPIVRQQTLSNRHVYVLVGVVSMGSQPCGARDWPGIYTRIGAYMDWIQNTMKN